MKIEKINDNQIRCTLTKDDLVKRNLKLSELAYGSEKTQNLFREMVRQADYEYGFDTENTPLVVEAIPMNSDCLVLIITKIDDPEELDTRFSRFSPFNGSLDSEEGSEDGGDIADFMAAPKKEIPAPSFNEMLKEALEEEIPKHSFVFAFDSLATVMDFASQTAEYPGESKLFKSDTNGYLMVLSVGTATKEDFRKICMTATEYGNGRIIPDINKEYMDEHCDVLIAEKAIEKLSGK